MPFVLRLQMQSGCWLPSVSMSGSSRRGGLVWDHCTSFGWGWALDHFPFTGSQPVIGAVKTPHQGQCQSAPRCVISFHDIIQILISLNLWSHGINGRVRWFIQLSWSFMICFIWEKEHLCHSRCWLFDLLLSCWKSS